MPPPASYRTAQIPSISATPLFYPFCAVDPELEGVEEVAVEEEPGLSSGHPLSALISMHPSHQWSVDQLQALASDFGLVLASRPALRASLARSVGQRLVSRAAGAIYQGAGYSLQNIPLNYATQIFPAECLVDTGSSSCTTWRLESREHMLACFPPLLAESGYTCAGLTRMLREPTEPVFRRAATLMWPAEISHELKSTGEEKLYLNFQWVLFDEFGELHPPKDNNRREVSIGPEKTFALREQIFKDIGVMADRMVPLSLGWWNQLHRTPLLAAADRKRVLERAAAAAPPPTRPKRLRCADVWEVAAITDEKPGFYLVKWKGYRPSWEIWRAVGHGWKGDPLETWEPMLELAGTEAALLWEGLR